MTPVEIMSFGLYELWNYGRYSGPNPLNKRSHFVHGERGFFLTVVAPCLSSFIFFNKKINYSKIHIT